MRTHLFSPPWGTPTIKAEGREATDIISDWVWAEAEERYAQDSAEKRRQGKSASKGMQAILNRVLSEKFSSHGWRADAGRFTKGSTWVRITFRHQMSLGSDILDVCKQCKKDGISLAIILAGDFDTLSQLAPSQAQAMVSFEKLRREIQSLDGVIDIPLVYGKIEPLTHMTADL